MRKKYVTQCSTKIIADTSTFSVKSSVKTADMKANKSSLHLSKVTKFTFNSSLCNEPHLFR